jgi:hypothetical protein
MRNIKSRIKKLEKFINQIEPYFFLIKFTGKSDKECSPLYYKQNDLIIKNGDNFHDDVVSQCEDNGYGLYTLFECDVNGNI